MDTSIFKQLKEQNMVLFLEKLGHLPKRKSGHSFWYLSPFRTEQTPSFKISRGEFRLDLFWDYGTGDHGNMVDFCCKFYNMTPRELYHYISSSGTPFFFDQPILSRNPARQKAYKTDCRGLIITTIKPITHPSLIHYIESRAILAEFYDSYCKEIHYQVGERSYFAIGFPNDKGGWELRSAYFKGASSPKSYSKIGNASASICIFEGFMDFLSFLTVRKHAPGYLKEIPIKSDFLILNSLALWEKCLPILNSYGQINLFLDRDGPGQLKTKEALVINKKFCDQSERFVGAKDVNEWLVQQKKDMLNKNSRSIAPCTFKSHS